MNWIPRHSRWSLEQRKQKELDNRKKRSESLERYKLLLELRLKIDEEIVCKKNEV
jgi:hypothetical protein